MSLTTYTKKRDFKQTSEPKGKRKSSKDQLLFAVQKHDASHLHYDFRLELDGVLVSWAVPKGPSMNPNDKRLAMKVEDHPYSYKDFEGTIPEGNYGAGNVIVWDNGTYHYAKSTDKAESEKAMRAGLKKGHLHFTLSGKKLKGEFSLVKLHGRQENAWLLIKTQDKYASEKDILEKDRSVITKKKLEARERKTKRSVKKTSLKTASKAKKKPGPVRAQKTDDRAQFKPMFATLSDKPFDNVDWLFELKYKGNRALAFINIETELLSEDNVSLNKFYAHLLPELKKIRHSVILDGVIITENEKDPEYYIFDLLSLDGNDTRTLPLIERKELLKLLLRKYRMKNIFYADFVKGKGNDFFDLAVSSGQDGIIAKQKKSIYHAGRRSSDWLEIKANKGKQPSAKKTVKKTKKESIGKEISNVENDRDLKVGKVNLHLTNQQKVFFPEEDITKGDLVNYYNEVASLMLPYLKDRPQSMNRFPNGIKGPSFYQKDVDAKVVPAWLETKKIYSKSNKSYVNYLICNDKATLLYMTNLGCIEINPWNSKISNIDNPDWMVIDLDPEKIAFKEVVKAALEVRNIMDELETECYCKTSGATGLHVYIPLAGKYDYDVVKTFAELIAQTVFSRLPETTSIIRNPQKRQKKVYIDFLQNRKGQTLAAPYSVRPKPGATVSTPLKWSEVNDKLDPANYTIKTVFKRLDKFGDLWKPVIGKGAKLDKIIRKLSAEEK